MDHAKHVARIVSIASPLTLFLLAGTWFMTREMAPNIHVRWRARLSAEDREALERRFELARPQHLEKETWAYDLLDTTRGNVEALVKHPDVDDTHEIDRAAFRVRPQAPHGRSQIWLVHRLGIGFLSDLVPAVVWILVVMYVVSRWLSFRRVQSTRH